MIKSSDIPPLATTGIGSLPDREETVALDRAFAVDIPYFPSLPAWDSGEGILVQGLAGLPGLSGVPGEWRCAAAVGESNGESKRGAVPVGWGVPGFGDLFPQGPGRLWEGFLERLDADPRPWAKLQLVGPATASAALDRSRSGEVSKKVREWLVLKAAALIAELDRRGKRVLFFWDEPGLGSGSSAEAKAALREAIGSVRRLGAAAGIHCCGRWDFAEALEWPLDILSFDVEAAGEALLARRDALRGFLARGGRLALGLVPTSPPSAWNSRREVEQWRTRCAAALGDAAASDLLARSLLTPACGLGLRSVAEAEQVFRRLQEVKSEMSRTPYV